MIKALMISLADRYYLVTRGSEYVATKVNPDRLRQRGAKIGVNCRIYSTAFSSEPYLITIGDHVTITAGVMFVPHDGGVWIFREKEPDIELFGRIFIGNNVMLGVNSIILYGTTIRNNSIVGAGSVVKGDFPDNSVIAGVPAKRLCSIDEYYEKNKLAFSHTRSTPLNLKRQMVTDHLDRFHKKT